MFGRKQLKLEIEAVKSTVEGLMSEIASLKEDYDDFLEWKKMRDANEAAAAKMGHWYVSATDAALIEKCIQEINKQEDLCALLTNSQGSTLSLRVHPQPKLNSSSVNYGRYAEEE